MNKLNSQSQVLIVDDIKSNRVLLKGILSKKGYRTLEAEDGQSCLELCETMKPTIILLDIVMPGINGIEVCKILRSKYTKEELPIILVTAKNSGEDLSEGLSVGANDYITKPIDKKVLLSRLENQLTYFENSRKLILQQEFISESLRIQSAMGDSLPEAIAVVGEYGEIVYYNRQLLNSCANLPPSTISDLINRIFDGGLKNSLMDLINSIVVDPKLFIDAEFSTSGNTNNKIQIYSRYLPSKSDGDLRLWIWRDVTHLRDLEQKIEQQLKMNTVSLFATGVAHNFNNIMGAILGASSVLKRAVKEDGPGPKCLKIIEKSIIQASGLIRKMQVLTKDEIGGVCEPEHMVLHVVRSIVDVQKELLEDQVRFKLSIPERHPPLNIGYRNLVDILSNLVINAVESITDQSNGTVEIDILNLTAASCIEIVVSDNGIGIPPANQSRVYEPFFSTKSMDTQNGVSIEGRGLGLWNVYNLVKMSGGEADLRSEVGKGTRVSIKIPYAK